jgi:methylmalonyl-CoA/ethylmalonyl-CoA epimerase
MILGIEHLGIAIADSAKAIDTFEKILGTRKTKTESVASEKVNTHFFPAGESQIELLESTDPEGVISKYIAKRGQGIHHIALKTDNILAEVERLLALGFEFINPVPKEGADNKLIVFLHPRCTEGVLIELCQDKSDV